MAYVQSYVLPVPTAQFDAYHKIAADSAVIWLELGALSVMEARAENATVGKLTSFPRSVLATEDETVVVAYITFRDRAHRDAVMAKMESDPRMLALFSNAPIDGKRMIWGGFETFVNMGAPH